MIERICHIGPALNVQGGISSVLVSYKSYLAYRISILLRVIMVRLSNLSRDYCLFA